MSKILRLNEILIRSIRILVDYGTGNDATTPPFVPLGHRSGCNLGLRNGGVPGRERRHQGCLDKVVRSFGSSLENAYSF